jgi:hypothetical protein
MYSTMTNVSGYCNEGDLANEDSWDWQNCHSDKDVDFDSCCDVKSSFTAPLSFILKEIM